MLVLQEALEKIGLTDKETRVYLAALELGPQPASTFAKRARLNRSTGYVVLNSLINKGLMSSCARNGVTRYMAVNPDKLLKYINGKRLHYEECGREITDLLPKLHSLSSPYQGRPKVRHFDGVEGVKAVMEDTLVSKGVLRCYSSLHMWLNGPLDGYIRDYGKRRIFESEIPLKSLVHYSDSAQDYLDKEYPKIHNEYRFIPENIGIVDNEVNIYNNKVAIVSLKPDDFFGVIIESPQIAETQKSIFELAWLGAEKGGRNKE